MRAMLQKIPLGFLQVFPRSPAEILLRIDASATNSHYNFCLEISTKILPECYSMIPGGIPERTRNFPDFSKSSSDSSPEIPPKISPIFLLKISLRTSPHFPNGIFRIPTFLKKSISRQNLKKKILPNKK